jgi:predicted nucleotidyltransferase
LYRPKDFIQTTEGLIFAIVAENTENGYIRAFLRYVCLKGSWRKLSTEQANAFLAEHYPQYLFYSKQLDAHLHAVLQEAVTGHFSPKARLQYLLQNQPADPVCADFLQLCSLLAAEGIVFDQIGITGSLLIGLQNSQSDIDLVCYDRQVFHGLRLRVKDLIRRKLLNEPTQQAWQDAYLRRNCSDLDLNEYIAHERLKHNKAIINQRKFDISLLANDRPVTGKTFNKLGAACIEAEVTDDQYAFDYPAEFKIDHPEIGSVVSFTATYSGQAQTGDMIRVAGFVEADQQGVKRLVVGYDRESPGQYIKCIERKPSG